MQHTPFQPVSHTLEDLLTYYDKEHLPTKAPITQYQHSKIYRWILDEFGPILLTDITPDLLRQWKQRLLERYSHGTVRRYLDVFSGPLTVAVRELGWLPANPMHRVKKPKESPGRVRFLSPEEQDALLLECRRSRNPHLYVIVTVALATGARKSELLGLRWRDIDLERGYLRLARTKNGTKRAVPIAAKALQMLRVRSTIAHEGDYVFPRFDGAAPIRIEPAWRAAVRRAGLKDFRFHDLRHSCASFLAMSGASLTEIGEILGHKSPVVTRRYAHLTASHMSQVVQTMAEKFLALALVAGTWSWAVSDTVPRVCQVAGRCYGLVW